MTPPRDHLHDVRAIVQAFAAQRGGAFRRSDLQELGIDPEIVKTMCRRGWWTRLHHGIYADTESLPGQDPAAVNIVHTSAAISSVNGDAFAYGPSAALVHGHPVEPELRREVHIVRPKGRDQRVLRRRVTAPSQLGDVTVHRLDLSADSTLTVRGVPTLAPSLACFTTACLSSREWALATLDSLAWRNSDALDELAHLHERWSHLRGSGTVREVLPLVRTGAQTPLESLSRIRFMDLLLPEPSLQVPLHDDDGLIGYVDMYWEEWRVVGEADGAVKYGSREDVVKEKIREDRIRATGRAVVRWTWAEVMRDPAAVARRIMRARNQARRWAA